MFQKRATLTVAEVASLLGVHRLTVYGAIARGELPAIRLGRRVLIPKDLIDRLLDRTPAPASGGAKNAR